MKIDLLAICAHPDDAELTCAGLLLKAKNSGASIGVVDLTSGEMGSRGSGSQRRQEADEAAKVLGLDLRLNLGLPDGRLAATEENCIKLVELIRRYRPDMLIGPWWEDHHPDHVAASELMKSAWWFAGVHKYPADGEPHRPERVLHYPARYMFQPSLVVDISSVWETKKKAVACYPSQLHDPTSKEPAIYCSDPQFEELWEGRHRSVGALIGVPYGEAYLVRSPVPVFDPLTLLAGNAGVV